MITTGLVLVGLLCWAVSTFWLGCVMADVPLPTLAEIKAMVRR